jgi:hypothetical protein
MKKESNMRKLFLVLTLVAMLFVGLVPSVLADIKPTERYKMIDPGDADFAATFGSASFGDLWFDMMGVGAELPAGDDWASQGAVGPTLPFPHPVFWQHGIDIGFTFHFYQGPLELAGGWPPMWLAEFCTAHNIPIPQPWNLGLPWDAQLSDKGYEQVFVSANGFIVFDEHARWVVNPINEIFPALGLGHWNWDGNSVPNRGRPNNMVAPYWTDWVVGSNDYQKVEDICPAEGAECLFETCRNITCIEWDGCPDECVCVDWEEECTCYTWSAYEPCAWSWVQRPRGRILVGTVGEEPFRRFIVQWQNVRHFDTGFLADFQLQLNETSNSILFLYNAFDSKEGPYFEGSPVTVGVEDQYGATGVGMTFSNPWSWATLPAAFTTFPAIPAAFSAGDMVGFVY